jgi:hypothetical protein
MLKETHPRVTQNTGKVEGVEATIYSLTTLQPGTSVWAYMVAAEDNAIVDLDVPDLDALAEAQGVSPIGDIDELISDFWPEGESVEDFIAAAMEGRYEGEDEPDS